MENNYTLEWDSIPWCKKYDRAIDDNLVNFVNPGCIDKHNGCGNCEEQYQKEILK